VRLLSTATDPGLGIGGFLVVVVVVVDYVYCFFYFAEDEVAVGVVCLGAPGVLVVVYLWRMRWMLISAV